MSRLEVVSEKSVSDADAVAAAEMSRKALEQQAVAVKMMHQALGALSQRAVAALAALFTLVTAASAFYLWMIALPTLDVVKIVGLTIYSLFILALNIYGRRK